MINIHSLVFFWSAKNCMRHISTIPAEFIVALAAGEMICFHFFSENQVITIE